MDSNLQNSIDLSQQSGRVCINNLQRRDNSIPASEQYTVDLTHRTDKMCLDKMQHTHGSYITVGSTAYTIVKKIEKIIDDLKIWLTGKIGTNTDTAQTSPATLFGKIADLKGTLTSWINGAWSTFYSAWTTFLTNYARRSDIPTDYARRTDIPTDYAKETNATQNKTNILTAISNLRGGTATVENIKTIVTAIQQGALSATDKTWLQQQFSNINLSSITNLIGTPTAGKPQTLFAAIEAGGGGGGGASGEVVKEEGKVSRNALFNVVYNPLPGTVNYITMNSTTYGRVSYFLIDSWFETTGGTTQRIYKWQYHPLYNNQDPQAHMDILEYVLTDSVSVNGNVFTVEDRTVIGAISSAAAVDLTNNIKLIQQRLNIASAYTVTEITDQAAETIVKNHLKNVYGTVSAQAGGTAADEHIAAAIVNLNGVPTKLYRHYLYAGSRKTITHTDAGQTQTIQVPDTGYGLTELWRKRTAAGTWVHYCQSPQAGEQSIATLHPTLETYNAQGQILEQDYIVTINPNQQ